MAGSDDWGIVALVITGCTDSTATNYDPAATVDDGSCTYPCTDNVLYLLDMTHGVMDGTEVLILLLMQMVQLLLQEV